MTMGWSYRLLRASVLSVLLLTPLRGYAHEVVIGDSLACGVLDAGKLYGVCRVGASPKLVNFMLLQYPAEALKGSSVILSCGVSNNPSQIDYCRRDLAYLTANGAKVIMLGIGTSIPDSVALMQQLKLYSNLYDAPLVYGWHDVHPQNYGLVLRVIRGEECRLRRICSI